MNETERLRDTVDLLRREKSELRRELNASRAQLESRDATIARLKRQLLIERGKARNKENEKPISGKAENEPIKEVKSTTRDDDNGLGLLGRVCIVY